MEGNVPYPAMKLVDMYFWSLGAQQEKATKDAEDSGSE
jgi:hypothetical protein